MRVRIGHKYLVETQTALTDKCERYGSKSRAACEEISDVDQQQRSITRTAEPVVIVIAHRTFRQSGMVHSGESLTV